MTRNFKIFLCCLCCLFAGFAVFKIGHKAVTPRYVSLQEKVATSYHEYGTLPPVAEQVIGGWNGPPCGQDGVTVRIWFSPTGKFRMRHVRQRISQEGEPYFEIDEAMGTWTVDQNCYFFMTFEPSALGTPHAGPPRKAVWLVAHVTLSDLYLDVSHDPHRPDGDLLHYRRNPNLIDNSIDPLEQEQDPGGWEHDHE